MDRYSENYYHRICYLQRKQVPTQTVMKKKMCTSLAQVYFKSMSPRLKVLAGLEPPMQGGGSDWFVPPQDLLQKINKLKPVTKKQLAMLSALGVDEIGIKVSQRYQDQLYLEMCRALEESNAEWRKTVAQAEQMTWDMCCRELADENSQEIRRAFNQFRDTYRTSVVQIENMLFQASREEIKRIDDLTYLKMSMKFQYLLKQQATMLYDRYTKKLMDKKERLKQKFIKHVEILRNDLNLRIREIRTDKHMAIEKLRHLLQCQRLACQVYVALKERQECQIELEQIKKDHRKHAKFLRDKIAMKTFEIRLAQEKEQKRIQFENLWKRKVCHVVKKLQMFVHYSLKMLPEHAQFFLDMEKLMMLQLSEAVVTPEADSIFEPEEEFHPPAPRPHPLIVYKDLEFKPQPDARLCPSRCWSSCSHLPVVVVNRRYIYTACDNMNHIPEKILDYITGQRGVPELFEDKGKYDTYVPVEYTREHGLAELKLESSLMQVLQSELPNINELPTECCVCKLAHCFCSPMHASKISFNKPTTSLSSKASSSETKYPLKKRSLKEPDNYPQSELIGYINYLTKNRCACANLYDHYPEYMRKRTTYVSPKMPPVYQPCAKEQLALLVKKYQKKPEPVPTEKIEAPKNVATQPSDMEFDELCNCFSDLEVNKIYEELVKSTKGHRPPVKAQFVTGPTSFDQNDTMSGFARKRALSLRTLIDADSEMKDIFKCTDCEQWK